MILPKSKAALVRALHRRKGRRDHASFLVEGDRALDELARSDATIHFAFARERDANRIASLFPATTTYLIDDRSDSLFATENPQGTAAVVATLEQPDLATLSAIDAPLIALDGVADPGNLGTIMRSAEWFAVGGVVLLPECSDPYNPKAVRASMGSMLRVPFTWASVQDLVDVGRPMYVLDARAERFVGEHRLDRRATYVVGSEAHGISDELLRAGQAIAIRGDGSVESLNAAVAASILCYELSRVEK